jgi:hypothetical protein
MPLGPDASPRDKAIKELLKRLFAIGFVLMINFLGVIKIIELIF